MLVSTPSSGEFDVGALVGAMERDGYVVIDDYLSPQDMADAQESIIRKVRANGNETVVALHSFEGFENPFLSALPTDPQLVRLCRGVSAKGFGAAPDVPISPSLRCLTGKSAREHSMYFHFDSYAVTAIIPILVPSSGKRGRLIVSPNTRKIRKIYFANFLDKLVSDRKRTQNFYRAMYERNSPDLIYLDMKPGSLYLFSGYRSMHTNEEVDADQIRATAIFHYFDPHAQSMTKKLFRLRFKLRHALAALMGG
jgi:hypothetical protein